MSKFNSCLRSGRVSFGDDLNTVAEVTHLFGMDATKLPYHNWFNKPNAKDEIVCLLSEDGGNGWRNAREFGPQCDKCGWNEVLSFGEFNLDSEKTVKRIEDELARPRMRHVFWREVCEGVQWYKFYGTFSIDTGATRATVGSDNPRVVYRRVSETAECRKAEAVKARFSDDEFKSLCGKVVEYDFLDEVAFDSVHGDEIPGKVTVWPGMKLIVVETGEKYVYITGSVNGKADTRFVVPRKDFELGYLHVLPDEVKGKENVGKVVEAKKPFQIHYDVYYYGPFGFGGNWMKTKPGVKFKITGLLPDGDYACTALDGEFVGDAADLAQRNTVPYLRERFGYVDDFHLPALALVDGRVEVVDWTEPETTVDSDDGEAVADGCDWDDEEEEACEEKQVCGYPDGYAVGEPHGTYCVIDLLAPEGGNPVSYLPDVPEGGWTNEYKTTKIVLKLVKGGEFTMGNGENPDIRQVNPPHPVSLPNDFYIGVFPVTKRQFDLVAGGEPGDGDQLDVARAVCPANNVAYNDIRGHRYGFNWPELSEVDYGSFLGRLRQRCGIKNIDIPTAAQWEYACKAGSAASQSLSKEEMAKIAWSEENAEGRSHSVGQLQPNAWGLYDMLGNVWEWCLDWYGRNAGDGERTLLAPAGIVPDFPKQRSIFSFMLTSRQYAREMRGGGWNVPAAACDASSRGSSGQSCRYGFVGFRLSITLQ